MQLTKGSIIHTIGDTQMMVAAGPASRLFHGMVQSNTTTANKEISKTPPLQENGT